MRGGVPLAGEVPVELSHSIRDDAPTQRWAKSPIRNRGAPPIRQARPMFPQNWLSKTTRLVANSRPVHWALDDIIMQKKQNVAGGRCAALARQSAWNRGKRLGRMKQSAVIHAVVGGGQRHDGSGHLAGCARSPCASP